MSLIMRRLGEARSPVQVYTRATERQNTLFIGHFQTPMFVCPPCAAAIAAAAVVVVVVALDG